ncbi:MAG: phosphatidate cytidylyltransferase [Streptosporangiales bacterium]|nr:phosphatidate cytidylyltransferase [Streptosporangiales bacterium]
MDGLYALKPWYARQLTGVRRRLVARQVSPTAVSIAGVGCAAAAAPAIVLAPPHAVTALVVGLLLVGRLACANLDGGIARESGRTTARGSVVNELSDRLADMVVIAAFAVHVPWWLVGAAACAALLPAGVSLSAAAAGAVRLQGGPVGKTERCVLAAVAVGTGYYVPVLAVLAAGSAFTAGVRLVRAWRLLGGAR